MSQNQQRSIWDKIWKDKDGNVVVMQVPNGWLIAWILLLIISVFLNRGTLLDVVHWAGSISLAIWAALELLKGVNYFRRTLGFIVLVYTVVNLIGAVT